ncbi:hypothetical protein VI817_007021 [Penicillium citrinum]|nr:hypothetical protein VI817_007021 [Penicillium citrinum]
MAKMALQLPLAAITRTARVLSIRQHRLISTLNHGFSTLSISRNFNSTLRLRPTYRTSFSYPPLSTSTKTCSANTIIRVPTMAESITEGTLVQMKKNVGDFVEENEELATIETDKIDVSVNAPHPGIMQRLLAREGDTVAVEQIIAELQFAGDKRPGSTPEIEQARDEKVPRPEEKISERSENTQEKLESSREPENVILPSRGSEPLQTSHEAVSQESKARSKEHRVKMTRIRQKTAQHLKQSQNTAAFLTTFNEVDMSRLMKFRKENREQVLQQHGIKLGYMGAMARASALALKKIPAVNAAIENGDTIVYRDYVDLSVAAAIPKGLVTPVLQNIELMSLIEIEKNISDLVAKVTTFYTPVYDSC